MDNMEFVQRLIDAIEKDYSDLCSDRFDGIITEFDRGRYSAYKSFITTLEGLLNDE